MGFFDDYFQPQGGRGLTGWLESLQQQSAYQPDAFAGWPQFGPTASPTVEAAPPSTTAIAATPQAPVSPPTYPGNRLTLPAPGPPDIPSGSIPIGDYLMPQFGTMQAPQNHLSPDLGDRVSAGFRSWAYTPVGNPFAALANAITGFTTGQFASAPALQSSGARLRSLMPLQEDSASPAAAAPAFPSIRTLPVARVLPRRAPAPRR